jgi:hypothetical protein
MPLKLGKKPARPDAVRFKFSAFFDKNKLPTPPAVFGHYKNVQEWGVFKNDEYGDCVWAGAAHETMMWGSEVSKRVTFTDKNVLSDYTAVTGFNPNDLNTDGGTDMEMAASYRRKTGVLDANGHRHKIDSYIALKKGSISDLMLSTYLFGATGVGIMFPDSAMKQFDAGKIWSIVPGEPEPTDGHYIPVVGRNSAGNILCVTWGRLQAMTPEFYMKYNDESIAYVSLEPLATRLVSPEGFDISLLRADLKSLS